MVPVDGITDCASVGNVKFGTNESAKRLLTMNSSLEYSAAHFRSLFERSNKKHVPTLFIKLLSLKGEVRVLFLQHRSEDNTKIVVVDRYAFEH